MNLVVRAAGSVTDLNPGAWDALEHGPSPFLRYGFLAALEETGSIDAMRPRSIFPKRSAGWASVYLLAEQGGRLVGAVAAFV